MQPLKTKTKVLVGVAASFLLMFAGCGKKESASTARVEPAISTIQVEKRGDGIHLKSSQAEFVLAASGRLLALQSFGKTATTIDDTSSQGGTDVLVNHKWAGDFVRDLNGAEIRDASGKLGKLGKHVEVKGHSAST